ncbi:MAG: hypothetical protein WD431_03705 [Cyclobacteriaceae bacterium]
MMEKQRRDFVKKLWQEHRCLLGHLGNIALRSGQTLNINPQNGQILDNKEAMQYWSSEYEPGWEPTV